MAGERDVEKAQHRILDRAEAAAAVAIPILRVVCYAVDLAQLGMAWHGLICFRLCISELSRRYPMYKYIMRICKRIMYFSSSFFVCEEFYY